MLSNKNLQYEDTWDAFILKVKKFSPNQREALLLEARIDGKLSMICALSEDFRRAYSAKDSEDRAKSRQRRAVEEARLTPDRGAFRSYVDGETRAQLPPTAITRTTSAQRLVHRQVAATFWAGMGRGCWRGRPVEKIVAQERAVSRRARLLAAPYGPPVSNDDMKRLRDTHKALRPRPKSKVSFNPAGMTPERALQIAMSCQNP